MPITFNPKDFNLDKILYESDLVKLKTAPEYYIVGLKENKNKYCVEISYHYNTFPNFVDTCYYLRMFFNLNNISFKEFTGADYIPDNLNVVKIGLRKDLRNHINLIARILEMCIYGLEKKIKLYPDYWNKKVPNLPVFY